MLKITFDWKNKKGELKNQKKKDFLERLFSKLEAKEIKRLDGILGGKKLVLKEKAKFVRKHEKGVASRNHVRKLYEKVGLSNSCAFFIFHNPSLVWCSCSVRPKVDS
jgi:hypothetical protein